MRRFIVLIVILVEIFFSLKLCANKRVSVNKNKENCILIGRTFFGDARDVYVVGDTAYVCAGISLLIFDVTNKTHPILLGYYDMGSYAHGVYVVGDYAYVADYDNGLVIIDVSDPVNPTEVGYYDTDGYAYGVYVAGDYAYVADDAMGLRIIDVSDPTNPTEVGYYDTNSYAYGVYVAGDYAYVADGDDGLYIIYSRRMMLKTFNNGIYYTDDTDTIKWEADTSTHQIEISYTTDNGATWTVIDTVSNTGSYAWTIPDTPSDSCKIRLQSLEYSSVNDESDDIFTITEGNIVLETFNSGLYYVGDTDTIKWDSYGNTENIIISYTIDNGATWTVIDTVSNTGSYAWTIPDTPSDSCKIRLQSLEYSDVYDESDDVFTITEGSIVLETFNSGLYYTDDTDTIKWSSDGNTENVIISYTTDNGATWTIIDTVSNTGSYAWTIPHTPSDSCKIRLQSLEYSSVNDESDDIFTITEGSIVLETFNSGLYYVGDTDTIKWDSDGNTENVIISYTTNNGTTWEVIDTVSNTGSYAWTIPDTPSDSCKIRLQSLEYSDVYDISDSVFTITQRYITLLNFNDGIYYIGDTDTIKWEADTSIHQVEISYTTDNGNTWTVIDSVSDTNVYVWNINSIASDNYRIKILSIDYPDVYDVSDTVFSVVGITIISPDTNDNVEKNVYRDIVWESHLDSSYVSILYSMDGGSSWEFIIDSTENDGNYSWYVNTDTLGSCVLRIVLRGGTTVYDDRNSGEFNIVDMVEITFPNGGEVLYPDSTYRIEWVCDTTVNYVNLYYSKDNGATWNLITGGYMAEIHYYDWKIPDITSDSVLVKIENNSDTLIYDISDSVFAINPTWVGDLINISHITIPTLSTGGIAIKYELCESTPINVKIYDMIGRLVKKETLHLKRGRSIYNIPVNRQGIYFVKIYNTNGELLKQGKVSVVR